MADLPELTHRIPRDTLPRWGVRVRESHHADDFRMPWRTSEYLKVVYVLDGVGRFFMEAQEIELDRRDVLVMLPGRKHGIADERQSPLSLYILSVEPALLEFHSEFMSLLPEGRLPRRAHLANRVEGRLRRLLFEQSLDRSLTPVFMVSQALDLLSILANQEEVPTPEETDALGTPGNGLDAYILRLEQRFCDAVNIDEAAREVGMSRRKFTDAFRRKMGCTWLEYVHRLRIEHACKLLDKNERSIVAIAFESGFGDLSSFYRWFKKRLGVSPSEWRSGRDHACSEANSKKRA